MVPILQAIREDIEEIRQAFASLEMRMVGGSLLIIYEADWTRAEEGVKRLGLDDEDGEEDEEDEEDEDDDDDDDKNKPGPPYSVHLIDFAHTRITPGEGPDQGVLTGIDTVLRLLDGRIKEVVTEETFS